ncbi:MAG: hypothetical protein ACXWQO_19605 [Bdellovibrionota bacterium]
MKYLFILLALYSPLALANAKVIGNGGDDLALEFTESFFEAYAALSLNNPEAFTEIANAGLPDIIRQAKILVVHRDLEATIRNEKVKVPTKFDAQKGLILLDRPHWQVLSAQERDLWAFHQALMLRKLETLEHFPISALLVKSGVKDDSVLYGIRFFPQVILFFENQFCEGVPLFRATVKETNFYESDWSTAHCSGQTDKKSWSYRPKDSPASGSCIGATKVRETFECNSQFGNQLFMSGS